MNCTYTTRPAALLLGFALTLFVSGCGGETGPETFDVTGKVTYKGEAVAEGDVAFFDAATGKSGAASLSSDGTYRTELEKGSYGVSITPPFDVPADAANSNTPVDADYKKVENIPQKYWSDTSSGFTADVTGDATFDFNME